MIGRPRIFVTQAEKQKAYRERKKQEQVLRNSSGSVLGEPQPEPNEVVALKAEVDRLAKLHAEHVSCFYQITVVEDRYDWWRKRAFELEEQWWSAHQRWQMAKHLQAHA